MNWSGGRERSWAEAKRVAENIRTSNRLDAIAITGDVCLAWEGLGAPSTGRVMPARRLKSFGGGAGPSMGCGGWPAPTEVAKIVNLVLPGAQLLQY